MIGAWSDSRWRLHFYLHATSVIIVVAKVAILRRAILSTVEFNGYANRKSLVADLQ